MCVFTTPSGRLIPWPFHYPYSALTGCKNGDQTVPWKVWEDSAYLLLRWPNRDEFLGVEVGGSLVPRLFPHVNRFSVLQATESWAGPGNEARLGGVSLQLGNIKGY